MKRKIFNIPATKSFLDVLAEQFLNEYRDKPLDLAEVLFLLPNRRACKSLTEAFVRLQGLKPTILPQMQPLSEVEEDELLIKGFDLSAGLKNLSPVMPATERLMLFAKIIMAKPADYGLEKMPAGQAAFLAKDLASLIDAVYNQQLSFERLREIVPAEYATHWQETLKFLMIITDYWPAILREQGKVDAVIHKNQLLQVQIDLWKAQPPQKRIVAAGTTAAFPLMKELVSTVAALDNGEVILFGLDRNLSDEDWDLVDEVHPQYEIKQLLDYLQIHRQEVEDLVPAENLPREVLLSEVMRPAKTSDKWRRLEKVGADDEAVKNMYCCQCADVRLEALAIALMMREVLDEPEKTAALVTTDRNLARRVAAELERWHIKVDDSAGKPLHLTPVGIFLRQIVTVVEQKLAPVALLGVMKYPLYANGDSYFEVRKKVRAFERFCLRCGKPMTDKPEVLARLEKTIEPLSLLFEQDTVELSDLLVAHLQVVERLATTNEKNGAKILWKGDDGEAAARFMADLLDNAKIMGKISPKEYAGWLEALMSGVTVRSRYGTHPRLKILGPIEARLQHFDRVIVGEVNENSWPQAAKADPWMSRPMKKDFGLPLPEKNIGVLAADFCSLLCGREVFITRAERVQGTPMVKSRWLMRMETVLQAMGINLKDLDGSKYAAWAEYLDKAQVLRRILPPAPKPPVAARPRELPASAVENWMRDPYIIFAKYILKLKPLDDLEQGLTFADYGTIVHAVLEEFNNQYSSDFPPNAREKLIRIGTEKFAANAITEEIRAFWWPNFLKTVDWLVKKESGYRPQVAKVYNEVKGQYSFEAPAGEFVITAKADRVDVLKDGGINIIDYKTGQARTTKEIENSYAPQLPIEAIIAEKGGFDKISAAQAKALIYWQLGKKESGVFGNVEEVVQNTYERIRKLASIFDFEDTSYISKPNPKIAPKYSDYVQLSRMDEITFADED